MSAPTAATRGRQSEAPSAAVLGVFSPLARRIAGVRGGSVPSRDPEFVQRQRASVAKLTSYFSPEVRGLEHLPESGPVLIIGNHSCLFYMPDAWIVGLAMLERRGVDSPSYALGYDLLFVVPGVSTYLRRMGLLPAAWREAGAALDEGAAVLVYPGGDWEACRPWTLRNRVDLAGHTGFIRLALERGVPVVPVVTHGSHDAVIVLARGERLARVMGLHHLRIKVFPLAAGLPFGVTTMLLPPLPMPSSITVEFLPALDWTGHGRQGALDDQLVATCYEEITDLMQSALDRLRVERPHPVVRGWSNLLRAAPALKRVRSEQVST